MMRPSLMTILGLFLMLGALAANGDATCPLGMGIGVELFVEVLMGDEGDPPPDPEDEGDDTQLLGLGGDFAEAEGYTGGGAEPLCEPGKIWVGSITRWGQGYLPDGSPNYDLNGAEATYVGGSLADTWADGSIRKYAHGAVGRCWLKTYANTRTTVSVQSNDLVLTNTEAGDSLQSAAWIGWRSSCGGPIVLDTHRRLCRGSNCMYLYVTTGRQGLSDAAGTYNGTVVVTLSTGW